jgi:EAL domain-containing protein (putative c-di-GMP-specific phosphodiesterase class I)
VKRTSASVCSPISIDEQAPWSKTFRIGIAQRKSGVAIAIDNFGTGSCRLGVLNQIHFSEIKIDRSLVQDCATNQGNKNICKTLIDTAHNFGSQAVAVGIASEADLTTLSGFGCDIGQGFLIGKPMTLPQVDLLIANFKSQVH